MQIHANQSVQPQLVRLRRLSVFSGLKFFILATVTLAAFAAGGSLLSFFLLAPGAMAGVSIISVWFFHRLATVAVFASVFGLLGLIQMNVILRFSGGVEFEVDRKSLGSSDSGPTIQA